MFKAALTGEATDGSSPEGTRPLVHIVDDDEAIRDALSDLLASVGLESRAYASTEELLMAALPRRPSCLVLDVRLPGGSGLELQNQLNILGDRLPVIFMTGHGDVAMCARAMKRGALEFLTKPFRDQDMLDAISAALESDRVRLAADARVAAVRALAGSLTKREVEVMNLVVTGLMNKQVASQLGITEITVKLHRSNVMRKLQASSLADLIRKAALLAA